MEVKCPKCGEKTLYTPQNPFRPFCSERCKLIDLGAWADGTYAVPSNEPISIQDPENMEDGDSE